jgi:hypothetical protein
MDTFKGDIAGRQFYFKPKNEGEFFIVEPYRQTGMKSFKLVKRTPADIDHKEKKEWLIPATENVPDVVRGMQSDFSDSVQARLAGTPE